MGPSVATPQSGLAGLTARIQHRHHTMETVVIAANIEPLAMRSGVDGNFVHTFLLIIAFRN